MMEKHTYTNPADLYTTAQPTTADLLDCLHDCARNLSDAVKAVNARGISVRVEQSPEGSTKLIQLIYSV